MDKKAGIGELICKVCGQQFQTGINYLSAGVDVYSDWIDACDSVAKDAKEAAGTRVGSENPSPYQHHTALDDTISVARRSSTTGGIRDGEMGEYGEDDA
ncbi:MAG: hypothetical protein L6R39_001252 [Caloplaca ligustica]|nr:MAG: hypothetical protein L6R39_001252 [Caloplaca ligustica]